MPETGETERIHRLMGDILRKASAREGQCFFRGEPECYPIVSSGLCRACPDSGDEMFDIGRIEQEIVESARDYTPLEEYREVLAEIQHFGGATNLLDFTDDYLIALFFASSQSAQADGRVVLHWPDSATVIRPKQTNHRIVFQKSVFVWPHRGFIVPDPQEETVVVPRDLKTGMLTFLARFHGISERSVYNDIHGYIRQQTLGRSRYAAEFREGLRKPDHDAGSGLDKCLAAGLEKVERISARYYAHQRGMAYADGSASEFVLHTSADGPRKRVALLPSAIVDLLTHCIENADGSVRLEQAYCWRGAARLFEGSRELAEADFERALELDAGLAEAYHGRANLRLEQGSVEGGVGDLEEALRLDAKFKAALIDRGNLRREAGSVDAAIGDFEPRWQAQEDLG